MKHSPTQKEIAEIIRNSRKNGSVHLTGSRDEKKLQLRALRSKSVA